MALPCYQFEPRCIFKDFGTCFAICSNNTLHSKNGEFARQWQHKSSLAGSAFTALLMCPDSHTT